MAKTPLDRTSRTYVAGHRGLVGSAVLRHLEGQGFTDLVTRTSSELDLRDRGATFDFFAEQRPEVVVLAAAKVGGIMANDTYPADFLSDNLRIQLNVSTQRSSTAPRSCCSWARAASTRSSPRSRSARTRC